VLKGCRIYEVSVGCSKNILEKSLDIMLRREASNSITFIQETGLLQKTGLSKLYKENGQ
jgi:hypothetical protein